MYVYKAILQYQKHYSNIDKFSMGYSVVSTSLELSLGDNLVTTQRYFSYHPVAFFDPPMHWDLSHL